MEGSGRMVVTAVGVNSQTGIIMTLLGATKANTNAQHQALNQNSITSFLSNSSKIVPKSKFLLNFNLLIYFLAHVVNGINSNVVNSEEANGTSAIVEVAVEADGKTKSVLQGKLSNLALQIGYIGKITL